MKPEILFLKYSYPCCIVLAQRKEINIKTMKELEKAAIQDKEIEKEILEKIFFRAISRMKALAKDTNYFTIENIRDYFINRHNELLDGKQKVADDGGLDIDKNAPKALKELCKVHKATIIKKEKNYFIVKFNNRTRPVINSFVPDAKIGDTVTIHYGYACEKI